MAVQVTAINFKTKLPLCEMLLSENSLSVKKNSSKSIS